MTDVTRKGSALRLCRQTIASLAPLSNTRAMAPKTQGARTLSVSGRTVASSLVAFLVTSLTANPFNVCGNNGWGYVCQALVASVGRYGSVTYWTEPKLPHRRPPQLEQAGT